MTDEMENMTMEAIAFDRLGIRPGARIAVVGGHGGIGAALCQRALEAGSEVISLDTASAIAERGSLAGVTAIPVNVLDPGAIAQSVVAVGGKWTGVDGLVYVSGVGDPPTSIESYTVDQWDRTQDINLRGAFLVTKAFLPIMQPGTGSIVLIASGLAINVEAGFAAYSASKAGLIAYAKVMAKEVAPSLRVNVVAPGIVETAFLAGGSGQGHGRSEVSAEKWFGPEAARKRAESILLQRFGVPDDIVAPILFLLGSGARFMTGQTLHVNGGRFLP